MPRREQLYRWEWQLCSSPDRLWPLVTDTDRFNREAGLPVVTPDDTAAQPNARQRLRTSRYGLALEWDEEPFEWVRPHRFGVRRWYRRGPLTSFHGDAELKPLATGGTHLIYETRIRPKNWFGAMAVAVGMRFVLRRRFAAIFHKYDGLAAVDHGPVWEIPASDQPSFAPGGERRLASLAVEVGARSGQREIVERLAETVTKSDDQALARLRPYALADRWGVSRRAALETCLHGARSGLFDLQWDLLCPLCRGAKASAARLRALPNGVHCPTCNIDVSASFDRSVEITFRPNPAIRPIEDAAFCVGGPQVTPHIVVQALVAAGERRAVSPRLEPGAYRLRMLGAMGQQAVIVDDGGAAEPVLTATGLDFLSEAVRISPAPTVQLVNDTDGERLFVLERTAWSDQAATAAEVTALQSFRDLFAGELLRPGEQISVGSLTVLFTDLRDSTRLYQQIGDAVAFARVLDHFTVLREEVAAEGGAVVKSIGDAIMAVFPRPVGALRAILAAQSRLGRAEGGRSPLALKAGMHHGPCIAVTMNERLDYFGSTVNLASRLERFSSGEDLICSAAVWEDPEVAELLSSEEGGYAGCSFEEPIKGFENVLSLLWRVTGRGVS